MRKRILPFFLFSLICFAHAFGQELGGVKYIYVGNGTYLSAIDGGGDDIVEKKTDSPSNYEKFELITWNVTLEKEAYFIKTYENYYLRLDEDFSLKADQREKVAAGLFYFEKNLGNTSMLKQYTTGKKGLPSLQERSSQMGKLNRIVLQDVADGIETRLIGMNRDLLIENRLNNRSDYRKHYVGHNLFSHNLGAVTERMDAGFSISENFDLFSPPKKPFLIKESKKETTAPDDFPANKGTPKKDNFHERKVYILRRKTCLQRRVVIYIK